MIPKEKWAEAIRDFHAKGVPELVEREISIPEEVPLKRAISIIGPRRAGKTYAMFQVISSILKHASMERVAYINFERSDLEGCSSRDLDSLMETFYEICPKNRLVKVWLFLDEIQNVENWEKFVRAVIDSENVQVFISGSSSKLLSREIATAMRGRAVPYKMLPFSFADYLSANKVKTGRYLSSAEKAEVINRLNMYMVGGGYPEVIIYPKEKEKLLADIFETTIFRDVIERYKIRNIKLLKLLIKSLISSAAKEFSVHKFYNFTKSAGLRAGKNSLYNYVDALNDVFFVFPLRKFSYSYRNAELSLPKIYLVDNGILTANGISGDGTLMENLVFIEHLRRDKEVYYYKSADGKEVDFVVLEKGRVKELLQVAFSLEDTRTREREIASLLKASKELKCSNLSIITNSEEGEEKIKGKNVKLIPLWKWLLR
ncbi:ATP-binding protein [Candidatus Woesearchaeota archaeon]|nr:ATP-binding protein [Candidatus Woesearchaeota archaeon]